MVTVRPVRADAIEPRYRALVLLATFGNLRWGELAGVRRRNLDLDDRRVRVTETVYEFGQLVKGTPTRRLRWNRRLCRSPRSTGQPSARGA
jgi:integrase